ncbi:MAG: imidazoleglycerol-phosphate dehydratase HisB [Spirochaetes bacterium]|nr:imidazoleglycerol-phosphate dehydratase HisB [Spirochaetota bacterium]
MERFAHIERKTKETDITLKLFLDSTQPSTIDTGIGFFNHMLTLFAAFSRMSIQLNAKGDLDVDAHHTIEDTGICLGKAFQKALGDKQGIMRFGQATVPMDEACSSVIVDISGRGYFVYRGEKLHGLIHTYSEECTLEFFKSFAHNALITMHIQQMYGDNKHHIHESIFKAAGLALYRAYMLGDSTGIPSTKGVL